MGDYIGYKKREGAKLERVTRSGTQSNNINFYFVCRKADLVYKKDLKSLPKTKGI